MLRRSIEPSEWTLILSLLFILSSLFIISQINNYRSTPLQPLPAIEQALPITISLSGAVRRPGAYTVDSGTPLSQVLRKARPNLHANLKNYNLDQPLLEDQSFQISELSEIVVTVQGAVLEPTQLALPVGARICDLKRKISLSSEADKQFLRRKRRLRDGETVEIPSRAPQSAKGHGKERIYGE